MLLFVKNSILMELQAEDEEEASNKYKILQFVQFYTAWLLDEFGRMKTIQFWIRLFAFFLLMGVCACGAIVIYGIFYWWYIPKIYHELPIDFQFPYNASSDSCAALASPRFPFAVVPFVEDWKPGHDRMNPTDFCQSKVKGTKNCFIL